MTSTMPWCWPTACWGCGRGPGRLFEEINVNLSRPRDRNSPLFGSFKRHGLTALDSALDRSVPDRDLRSRIGESMWW
jgi:sulfonate transport system ATP-binding protein